MSLDPMLLLVLVVGMLIATYRDIRVREVPDLVCYGLLTIGVLAGLATSLLTHTARPVFEHALGAILGIGIGAAMVYTKQWGGGDAKLLMGVGAILGVWTDNWRLGLFLLLLIVLGAVYGVLYTLTLAIVHRKKFVETFKSRIRTKKVHRVRIALVVCGLILLVAAILSTGQMRLLLGLLLLSIYLLTYAWIAIGAVEQGILTKMYPVGKLTEGDWLVDDISKGKRLILKKSNIGVTREEIALLKKEKVREVLVREGIPFVPGFLFALIALVLLEYLVGGKALGALLGL